MEIIRKRIANLLSVKSLVTIVLPIVFAFYFGTQSQKTQDILDNNESKEG